MWTAAAASSVFAALLSGASLHLLEPGALSPAALADRVTRGAITVWHSTPSVFRRLAGAGTLTGNSFRVIRLGGEPVLAADVELARRTCNEGALFVTGYSLTEANGAVTQSVVPLARAGGASAHAGEPIPGVDLHIERPDGEPVPAGQEGEIILGGELISGGYVPALAAEPGDGTRFERRGRGLVLRTGDRGALRPDGSLEIRGATGQPTQDRWTPVDPSEVEAAALCHGGVLDASLVPFTPAASGRTASALFARAALHHVRAACSIAASRWTPAPSATPVHLYRCDSQPSDLEDVPLLGCDRHTSAIALRRLPASHGYLRAPEVS